MSTVDQNQPDHVLIQQTLSGDSEAFGTLMRRYQGEVHRLLRGVLRNQSDTDDLTQEAFFRAYRYLDRFDVRRPFRPWIFRIGLNLAYQFLRRRDRRWLSLDQENPETGKTILDGVAAPGAQKRMTERLELHRVEEAMEQIPPLYRSILILRSVQGLSYDEIAGVLGVPEGTVMSRLSRARAALRQALSRGRTAGRDRTAEPSPKGGLS